MTTIVSRLYETREAAERVADILRSDGFPDATLDIITTPDTDAIAAARVDRDAAARYARAMTDGRALLVCRAPFTPFGAARRAQDVADGEASVDAGVANQNRYIREEADLGRHNVSVFEYHPLMMTRDDYVGSGWSGWRVSDMLGWTLVSRRRERPDNLTSGHMSRKFWPGKLLSTKPRRSSVISGGRHMSRGWWPMKLVTTGTKSSIMKDHPHISPRLGFPRLISRR
jgi:hypothetical protein